MSNEDINKFIQENKNKIGWEYCENIPNFNRDLSWSEMDIKDQIEWLVRQEWYAVHSAKILWPGYEKLLGEIK